MAAYPYAFRQHGASCPTRRLREGPVGPATRRQRMREDEGGPPSTPPGYSTHAGAAVGPARPTGEMSACQVTVQTAASRSPPIASRARPCCPSGFPMHARGLVLVTLQFACRQRPQRPIEGPGDGPIEYSIRPRARARSARGCLRFLRLLHSMPGGLYAFYKDSRS